MAKSDEDRAKRLAAALRENLKRRKARARAATSERAELDADGRKGLDRLG